MWNWSLDQITEGFKKSENKKLMQILKILTFGLNNGVEQIIEKDRWIHFKKFSERILRDKRKSGTNFEWKVIKSFIWKEKWLKKQWNEK